MQFNFRPIKVATVVVIVLCALGFITTLWLTGCSMAERAGIAQDVAQTITRTAVETGMEVLAAKLDALTTKVPTRQQSASEDNVRAIATLLIGAVVYLSRKKFFPMGTR